MNKSTIWTVVAVIAAVVIAWWLVNILFSVLWFAFKLAVVVVVAFLVYLGIRALFRRERD